MNKIGKGIKFAGVKNMEGKILTLDDFDFKGKVVLTRVDLNCPLDPETHEFLDDRRIKRHSKTIMELKEKGAKIVILAHQGRPGSKDFTTTKKHAKRLGEIIEDNVGYVPDLIGSVAKKKIKNLKNGEIILLENVRFLSEETLKRPADVQATTHFIRTLSPLADFYVNDAFAAAHRSQPSLVGFSETLPCCAGRIMENEIRMLDKAIYSKEKPSIFVTGGSKVKSSLNAIDKFLNRGICDKILTSGLVANIFLVAKHYEISGLEYMGDYKTLVSKARELLDKYGSKIEVPMDLALDHHGKRMEVSLSELPLPYRVGDIGMGTIARYKYIIMNAKTIIANGPAGIFEQEIFATGTNDYVTAIADSDSFSIIGGGHIATAITTMKLEDKVSHISTGGGACILYLAGESLPAIEALEKCAKKMKK